MPGIGTLSIFGGISRSILIIRFAKGAFDMRIILTNYSLEKLAGSETWTMTMYEYLLQSHEVDIYVSRRGCNKLLPNARKAHPKTHYDLALINHNSCLRETIGLDIDKRVFTSHGVVPVLEQPIQGADAYVSVSEEVQGNLRQKGFDSKVIRNPINTDYFTPSPVHCRLSNILFLNNQANPLRMVTEACEGYQLRVLSGHNPEVKENISWADLVISSGRGCYEAMSCGKNVMIVNRFGCDGMVTWENIFELRKNNCSGRRFNLGWQAGDVRREFGKYDPERNMRPYILEHNAVGKIAAELVRIS